MKTADRILIGWVDPGHVDGRFAADIARIYAERRDRIEGILRVEGGVVARQRNELVATYLDHARAEWLLMLDSDEHITIEAFDRLVAAAHDTARPVVAGVYFGAYPNPDGLYPKPVPLIYRLDADGLHEPIEQYPADSIIPIDAAGGGCLLIHQSVLRTLRDRGPAEAGERWCWFQDGPWRGRWLSEDLTFCQRIREAGIPLHAHTGAQLEHRKRYWLREAHHHETRTP